MLLVQGDVFLTKTHGIPQDAKKLNRTARGFVLAEGEATGHAHVIEDDIELYERDGVLYVVTDRTVKLKHEEHHEITISQGTWQVGQVREYDAFDEQARYVAD
ncbi:MAG: hypothetical protein HQK98_00855 [Nitrospirae bacterium]|nr:hypothetical protein [Nitrospirota bacterium]